jgi:hypothetical protein
MLCVFNMLPLLRTHNLSRHIWLSPLPCCVQILESIAIKVNLEDKESLIRAANT